MISPENSSTSMPVQIRASIESLPPYRQGQQAPPDAFKLSSNENPYLPLPSVLAAASPSDFNRYPDASASRLRSRLATRFGVQPDEVHVAAGSVSILHQLALAVAGPDDEIVYPWRSFEAYPSLAAISGATGVPVPLDSEFRHDLCAMAAAVTERTRMIVVCSPNNPTGGIVGDVEFETFLASIPSTVLVVLDEAYAEFVTDPHAVDGREIVRRGHSNVVVLRTFSKAYGIAGLRVGYAVGDTRILNAARATAIPLSVTAAGEAAALASLDADGELLERVRVLIRHRAQLFNALRNVGWPVPESQANFVWLPTGDLTDEFAAAFALRGVIVRPLGDGIRISIGDVRAIERVADVAAALREASPDELRLMSVTK